MNSGHDFIIGFTSGSTGSTQSGGTINVAAAGSYFVGAFATGVMTQSGGLVSINSASPEGLRLGHGAGGNGTYNLNGGTLELSKLSIGTATGTFNFGGGTLKANGTLSTSVPMSLTGIGGNATVDSNGNSVTFSGALSGVGGLTKTGTGTLTLSNEFSSYAGNVLISQGTLDTTGPPAGLGLNPTTGQLGNPQTVGRTVTVSNGAVLRMGDNDLFGNHGSTPNASVVIDAGGLVHNGGFYNILQNLTLNGGELRANGGANASFPAYFLRGTVTVGGSQASTITANTSVNSFNQIQLGVAAGAGTTTFNVANATGDANSDLTVSAVLQDGPAGGGGDNLTKTGVGTMELAGASANTYSGLTSVNDGTLALNKPASTNAFAGNLVIGDTVGLMGSAVVRLLNPEQIPDGSTITINADGVLDLFGNNETVGPLTLADGKVDCTSLTDTLTLDGTLTSSGTSSVGGANDTLDVNGQTVTVTNLGDTLTVTRNIVDNSAAPSQLVKSGGGALEIAGGATLGGPGDVGIDIQGGTVSITGGTVDLQGGNVQTNGNMFNLAGGILQNVDTIFGTLNQSGGTLINSLNSPDTMTITGDYTLGPLGTFVVDIAGNFLGDYDIYDVGGTANLDGVLKINLLGGFEPGLTGVTGIFWDVLVADMITIGPNFSLDTSMAQFTSSPYRGWAYEIVDLGDGRFALRLFVTPEPASVLVWGVAGLAALLYARRRRPESTGKPVAPRRR